ncbi:MAG TPA: biopolymer transporter ExbD, partial [Verrucomicrobiae bacterium]
ISLQADGKLFLNRGEIKMEDLLQTLINLRLSDPDLNIIVRGDGKTKYKGIRSVLDICQQANVPKLELATEVQK